MGDQPEEDIREKLIGFGEKSIHKSYFPQLRKRLEELELFHALLDRANDLIFLVDTASGVVLDANRAAYGLLGLTKVELAWKTFLDLFTVARQSPLRAGLDAAEGETHEVSHLAASGKRTDFELTLSTMTVAGHRYTVGVARDVTARKKAEDALRESETRLRTLVETAPMGIYTSTASGRYLFSNPANAAMYGYASPQELIGAVNDIGVDLYVDPAKRQEALLRLRQEGALTNFESLRKKRDGTLIWVATSVRLSHDPVTGEEVINGFSSDITERVRLQEMMIQSEKMASVGGLAAGMAHEINNPLSSILQAAQVSLMQLDPALPANRQAAADCGLTLEAMRCYLEKRRVLKFLEGIREAGGRAAEIVASMLEFSRKSDSRKAPARVEDILDASLALASTDYDLKKRYDFRHITIVREYEPNLPEIPCNRTEIEQVLLNLLKNAAQAMAGRPDGEAAPRIALRARLADGMVRIEVEDNGPGMDEATRKRIFEPFFTTKEPGQGTGLGLAVSYFIITANHGGTIGVESEPGKGARFVIELPLGIGS